MARSAKGDRENVRLKVLAYAILRDRRAGERYRHDYFGNQTPVTIIN